MFFCWSHSCLPSFPHTPSNQSGDNVGSIFRICSELSHFFHLHHFPWVGATTTLGYNHSSHLVSLLLLLPSPHRLSQHSNQGGPLKYKLDHVTLLLKTRSWLPTSSRVKASVFTKAYKALRLCCPRR